MRPPGLPLLLLVALAAVVSGCQPHIGDSCSLPSECSVTGDRLCEPNFPGGYCTIFNCEPGSCPSEAVCVAYGVAPSTKPECAAASTRRFARTFCMRGCSSTSDCRSGYECVDLGAKDPKLNPWGAVVMERGAFNPKVCTLPLSGVSPSVDDGSAPEAPVCSPPPLASFPWDTDASADARATGDAGRATRDAGADARTTGDAGRSSADAALRDATVVDSGPPARDASRDAQGTP